MKAINKRVNVVTFQRLCAVEYRCSFYGPARPWNIEDGPRPAYKNWYKSKHLAKKAEQRDVKHLLKWERLERKYLKLQYGSIHLAKIRFTYWPPAGQHVWWWGANS